MKFEMMTYFFIYPGCDRFLDLGYLDLEIMIIALVFLSSLNVLSANLQLESLPAMVSGVYSDDRTLQLEATTQFRKLLSIGI